MEQTGVVLYASTELYVLLWVNLQSLVQVKRYLHCKDILYQSDITYVCVGSWVLNAKSTVDNNLGMLVRAINDW